MDLSIVRDVSERSLAGAISFGEVVHRLTTAGVERYRVDFVRKETCYYALDGQWTTAPLHIDRACALADAFDAGAIGTAVRGAQQGTVKYPEFVERVTGAGCCGYNVFLNRGKMVVYEGRGGETHIERFPGTNR